MRLTILLVLALAAVAQMPLLRPVPAPTAPPGFEYVDYVDETGQTTPILVRTPTEKPSTASATCTNCTVTVDRPIIWDAPRYVSISTVDPDALPYLYVEMEPDYRPKSIMVRVDSKEVKMTWSEFEQMVRRYHHKDRLVWETQDGKEIR